MDEAKHPPNSGSERHRLALSAQMTNRLLLQLALQFPLFDKAQLALDWNTKDFVTVALFPKREFFHIRLINVTTCRHLVWFLNGVIENDYLNVL